MQKRKSILSSFVKKLFEKLLFDKKLFQIDWNAIEMTIW